MNTEPHIAVRVQRGQIWQHTGFGGVPGTGLQIRVLRAVEGGMAWVCDYCADTRGGERIYRGANPFINGYDLIAGPGSGKP